MNLIKKSTPISRRHNLMSEWDSLHNQMDQLFDSFFAPVSAQRGTTSPSITTDAFGQLNFAMDVVETEKDYQVTAELAGVSEEDIDVTFHDGLLTIKGEKKAESESTEGNYHRYERSYGSFQRQLMLRDDVQADQISASFKQGVLRVMLPKQPQAESKVKKISIG